MKYFLRKLNKFSSRLLFIILMGIVAWLTYQTPVTYDATRGNRNTLSEPTQQILLGLQQPLLFTAYVPEEPELHQQLRELVAKYQKFSNKVSLEIINPDLDPERAQRDGIQSQRQVVLRLGKQSEVLGSVAEQPIVNAIQRLQRSDNRLVIFLEGHKEAELFDNSSAGLSDLANELQSKGYKLQPHTLLSTGSIPKNTSFVVIAAPQQAYTPKETKILHDYIQQGGNLLWLTEPKTKAGLPALQKILAINIPKGRLLSIDNKPRLDINSPTLIPIMRYGEAEVMRQQQGQTLFSYATIVQRDLAEKPTWDFDAILTTSDKVWLETNTTHLSKGIKYDKDSGDIAGPVSLGIVLSKEGKGNDAKQQRIIVIGDSNFMRNGFVGYAGNLELSEHLFNWLSANEHLLVIPAKIAPDTKITLQDWQLYTIGIFFLFILPIGLMTIGIVRWIRRKRS
ncbi:MAG: GldG family protein [Cocleimonas sp.]|nr:GldG family protein [Cocleimonas sp.]